MRIRDLHLIILKTKSVMTLLKKKRIIKETYLSHACIYIFK
jgi:hypothetical protein